MEHIVQFAIGIDDKAIQNRIEEYAYKDVLDKIVKETMDTVFAHTNAYSRENMCKTMMEDALQSFLEERKDDNHKNDKNSKGITMATNVTQKDKTLNEIIDLCVEKRVHYRQFLNDFILTHSEDWHDSADVTCGERIMFLRGKIQAFDECAACCESMLGYSGSMPSEVPNQSEDAKK